MNILFLTTHFEVGGITSYILNLSKGLVRQGHCVYVASSGGAKVRELEQVGARHLQINIKTKSEISPKLFFSYFRLRNFLRTHSIDVIHSQTRVTQVLGIFLAKSTNIAHVTTCHGFFKKRLFRKIFPCWGDRVIAISPQVMDHLKIDFKVEEKRISLISHGISDKDLSTDSCLSKKQYEELQRSGKFIIGTVSRLSHVKGLDVLIKAFKDVIDYDPGVILLIVGEGREKESLENLSRRLGVMDHIRFLSGTTSLDEFFSIINIFIMPSRQEGLGLSVMEAQARGLAVIATKVGGLNQLVKDGETGVLVDPENPRAISSAIIHLMRDASKIAFLGKQAKKFIKEMFSFEAMIEKTLILYNNIIHEKNTYL